MAQSGSKDPTVQVIQQTNLDVENDLVITNLPEWMVPPKTHQGPPYTEHTLNFIFDQLAEGRSYASLRREDPTLPTYRELMKVVKANQSLLNEYYDAQETGSEALVDIGTDMAIVEENPDGSPNMDEVARLNTKLGWIKFLAAARYNKRYGEKKQLDVNNKLDLADVLKEADKRAEQHRITRSVTIEGQLESIDPNEE